MTVALSDGPSSAESGTVRATLRGVAVRSVPHLVEATLIPTALFYVAWFSVGRWGAFVAALLWAYGALARRVLLRRRVPGVLILALVALTVRTGIALVTGSTFVYFVQPVVGACVVAAVFFGSAVANRPLVARLASDFYPLTPEVADRHGVRRLFRHLTLLWAAVNLVQAVAAFTLLMTLPVTGFVAANSVVALAITATGIVVTVKWAVRVARREGLVHVADVAVATA
jgi:hypothetical protein